MTDAGVDSHFLDSDSAPVCVRPLLRLRKIWKHQLQLLFTLRNIPNNSY